MADRQPYPVGDVTNGQLVQVSNPPAPLFNTWTGETTLTVSTSAVPLPTIPVIATGAFITVEGAAIRFRLNDIPTATIGHQAEPGAIIELHTRDELNGFSAIRRDGVNATLNISYGVE